MTKQKAIKIALKIVDTCKKYGNEERCNQCPFNIEGCILDGETPNDWFIAELPYYLQHLRKDKNK